MQIEREKSSASERETEATEKFVEKCNFDFGFDFSLAQIHVLNFVRKKNKQSAFESHPQISPKALTHLFRIDCVVIRAVKETTFLY